MELHAAFSHCLPLLSFALGGVESKMPHNLMKLCNILIECIKKWIVRSCQPNEDDENAARAGSGDQIPSE